VNVLVVYDSAHGNTEILARAIGKTIADGTTVVSADKVDCSELGSLDLLIVGSPTQGGRPTRTVTQLLDKIPENALRQTTVATFDTRFAATEQGFGLRHLMGIIGYAAPRIAKALQAKGAHLSVPPEGYIVEGKEGPLRPGELERATSWATAIVQRQ